MKTLRMFLTLVALFGFSASAFAADKPFFAAYTADYGIETPKTDFAYDEKPWVFLKFTDAANNLLYGNSNTDSTWFAPDGTFFTVVDTDTNNGFWFSMSDDEWFGNSALGITGKRAAGDWTVSNIWSTIPRIGTFGEYEETFSANLNFKVNTVPEPISAGLFLLGGAGLAFARRRKA